MNKSKGNVNVSLVAKHFEKFYASEVFQEIIEHFSTICELLGII